MSDKISNRKSILLDDSQNRSILDLLGNRCWSLCTSLVTLSVTVPVDGSYQPEPRYLARDAIACFVKDYTQKTYFIRLYDLTQCLLIWEKNLCIINDYRAVSPRRLRLTFENENDVFWLDFVDEREADEFGALIAAKLAIRLRVNSNLEIRRMSNESNSKIEILKVEPIGATTTTKTTTTDDDKDDNLICVSQSSITRPSAGVRRRAPPIPETAIYLNNFEKDNPKLNLFSAILNLSPKSSSNVKQPVKKSDIGMPYNFSHITHAYSEPVHTPTPCHVSSMSTEILFQPQNENNLPMPINDANEGTQSNQRPLESRVEICSRESIMKNCENLANYPITDSGSNTASTETNRKDFVKENDEKEGENKEAEKEKEDEVEDKGEEKAKEKDANGEQVENSIKVENKEKVPNEEETKMNSEVEVRLEMEDFRQTQINDDNHIYCEISTTTKSKYDDEKKIIENLENISLTKNIQSQENEKNILANVSKDSIEKCGINVVNNHIVDERSEKSPGPSRRLPPIAAPRRRNQVKFDRDDSPNNRESIYANSEIILNRY